ncbi:Methyltransferase domain-containing protein [Nannocystis exedens]|uniref:Methyltransferase domain-containing protein n=1 Tax=Nannocystis exedens TaxID=54 RepID=A0A1I1UB40_9BACT|nr:class I SAM-dependent methyltransferase [Nannocystis exedens]PCC71572.1 SAM-dependent methyltransferase [Nannocystis exedens]SFD68071.1 Methyltransferase domain-containing protein [Nannocystis exedens]
MTDPATDSKRWDERFQDPEYVFGKAPNAFLAGKAHLLRPGARALVLADGEGRNGVWLAERGLDVLSVDVSSAAQDKARALAAERGVHVRFEQADLAAWDMGRARFDLVVAIFIQFALPPLRDQLLTRMQAALAPGGLLLLEGYRPEQLGYRTGGPPVPEYMYTAELLRRVFAELTILELVERDVELHEGHGHRGMSALIDLVARKP